MLPHEKSMTNQLARLGGCYPRVRCWSGPRNDPQIERPSAFKPRLFVFRLDTRRTLIFPWARDQEARTEYDTTFEVNRLIDCWKPRLL